MSIVGVEAARAALGRWQPEDLAFIEQIQILGGPTSTPKSVTLTALFQRRSLDGRSWPDLDSPFQRLKLEFSYVRNLRIHYPASGQIMGFAIKDVSDRQLEDVKYEVGDYEGNRLSFQCKSASLSVIGAVVVGEP